MIPTSLPELPKPCRTLEKAQIMFFLDPDGFEQNIDIVKFMTDEKERELHMSSRNSSCIFVFIDYRDY